MAAKPRVKGEIERIRRGLDENKLRHEERLAVALHPEMARNRMKVELFAIATSPGEDTRNKLKAWQMFGSMKDVDAFAGGTLIDNSKTSFHAQHNSFQLPAGGGADQAKVSLLEQVKRLQKPSSERVVDVMVVE